MPPSAEMLPPSCAGAVLCGAVEPSAAVEPHAAVDLRDGAVALSRSQAHVLSRSQAPESRALALKLPSLELSYSQAFALSNFRARELL